MANNTASSADIDDSDAWVHVLVPLAAIMAAMTVETAS